MTSGTPSVKVFDQLRLSSGIGGFILGEWERICRLVVPRSGMDVFGIGATRRDLITRKRHWAWDVVLIVGLWACFCSWSVPAYGSDLTKQLIQGCGGTDV
ncbi:MAG: hypothetical protein V2B18_10960, partial [Pseudomonadota bacterium]